MHKQGKTLRETREFILEQFGHHNFTDCVQNTGFIIAGLLYGEGDFLKTIASAVSCGYDADCTGATAGAVIGIIQGRERLSGQGCESGERVVPGWGIRDIEAPLTLNELTRQVVELGEQARMEKELPVIPRPFSLPEIPEFVPPFEYPVSVSTAFSLQDAEKAENTVLNGGYRNFRDVVFTSPFFDLNPHFEKTPSAIFLQTTVTLPEKKKVKLFPTSTDGIKMWLDGKLILAHHQHGSFLPAPHRPGSPLAEAELEKGEHTVLLEVMRCGRHLEFAWIVADENNHLLNGIHQPQGTGEVTKQKEKRAVEYSIR